MAKLNDFIQNLKKAMQDLAESRSERALAVSANLIALGNLRRVEDSLDAGEDPFSDYSGQYAKYRKDKGRQTERKDYFFTGALNRSIQPEITAESDLSVTVGIAARGEDNQNKVLGAIKYRKKLGLTPANILLPTDDELQLASEEFRDSTVKIINKYL